MSAFNPLDKISEGARELWAALTGTQKSGHARTTHTHPEVIVHDPASQGPHDLDDPFYDPKVQNRVADVIANAGQKK